MTSKLSIPDVGFDLDSHTRTLQAIKEAVETGQGSRRDAMASYMTMASAVSLGFVGSVKGQVVPKQQQFLVAPTNSPWQYYPLDSSFNRFGFYKDALGRVFIRGLVATGTSATAIASLPVGYRPERICLFAVWGQAGGIVGTYRIDVYPNGTINYIGAGTADYLSLDGISFAAYQ